MPQRIPILFLALMLLIAATVAGWLWVLPRFANQQPEELPRVQGQVLWRGVPLGGGTIVFTPDPERGGSGPLAVGVIGPDGRYTLTTDGKPGAVAGWHRVSIAGLAGTVPLPDVYHNPEQSKQSREVKTGTVNTIDLQLE